MFVSHKSTAFMTKSPGCFRALALFAVFATLFSITTQPVLAQTDRNWTGGGGNGNWNWNNNWTNGSGGEGQPQNGDRVYINNNTQTTMTNNSGVNIGQAFFQSGATTGRTISSGISLTDWNFGAQLGKIQNDSSGSHTINGAVGLNGGNTVYEINPVNASGTLTLAGGITGFNNASKELRFFGAGTAVIAGINGGGSGSVVLRSDSGAATVVINGSSAYTGTTVIQRGTLILSNNSALGTSSQVNLGANSVNAATLRIGQDITNSRNINVEFGSGTRTLSYQATSGTGAQTGNITLNNSSLAFNISSGGTLLFGGGLTANGTAGSDTNRLAIDGGGTLIVTNNGTGISSNDRYQVRIGSGTLIIGSGTIISRTNFPSGPIGHALDLGVDLDGNIVNATSSLRASNSVTISNSIYVSTTNSQARNIGAAGAGSSVTYSGRIDLASSALTIDSTNEQSVNVSGVIADTGSVTKTGTGTATFSGSAANTYSGTTTVSAGTLQLNKTAGVNAIATNVVVTNSGSVLLISANNQVADGAAITLSGGTIQRGSGVTETFGNLNLTAASFIDFGTGTTNSLNFGTYTGGGFKLNVTNFLAGNILTFKTDLTTTISNTTLFGFDNGFNSGWNIGTSTFTITAIPEPSTVAAAVGLAAVFLWPARRRLVRDARSILGLRAPMRDRLASRHDHA